MAAPLERPLNVLLLGDDRHVCGALQDHLNAFARHSRHHWFVANPAWPIDGKTWVDALDFDRFDLLAIHYSVGVHMEHLLPGSMRKKIARWSGPKVLFMQDEYRWVNQACDRMVELGIHTLFTLARSELVPAAYPDPRLRDVRKVTTLTGYVPDHLVGYPAPPIAARRHHVTYRSRQVPFWLGDLAQDKVRIAEGVRARADAHGLSVDVSVREEDRIYGPAWLEFICSGRAVLGTESGASIWDRDGSVQREVDAWLERHPGAPFERVAQEVLAPHEGNLVYTAISPRVFEAIALRTPSVMFPGWYSGVVEPDRHYIQLEKDFSNFDEVARKLRDAAFLEQLATRAYDEIIGSGRYGTQAFVDRVDEEIETTVRELGLPLRAQRQAADRTRAHLERTIATLRTLGQTAWSSTMLPAAHEASVLLDANAGSPAARLGRATTSVPRSLLEVAQNVTRPFRREAGLGLSAAGTVLFDRSEPLPGRTRRVVQEALSRWNMILPEPAARLLRATGAAFRGLAGGNGGNGNGAGHA